MAATGVAVLILAIVTGSVYASARAVDGQVSEFVSVGTQLDGIQMIGEQGLLAVADAQMAKIAAANAVEEDTEEQKEKSESVLPRVLRGRCTSAVCVQLYTIISLRVSMEEI